MDNVTHTLTGLMLARAAGLGRGSESCPLPRAPLMMIVAANIPDIDIVSGLFGTEAYLDHHRWITHGFFAAPLMALLSVGVARLSSRGRSFPWLFAWTWAFIAVLSHLALDWTNVYGIRLYAPFSNHWYRLDITNIIDPWILAALLLALAAPWLARLVGSEIASRTTRVTSGPERGWAIFALAMILFYEGARYIAHTRAIAHLSSRLYEQTAPERVAAVPQTVNPLLWNGVVELPRRVTTIPVDLRTEFDPAAGRTYYAPGPEWNGVVAAARANPSFQAILRFSQLPFWKVTPLSDPEGAVRVQLFDLRFGTPDNPAFVASGIVRPGGAIEGVALSLGKLSNVVR